VIVAERIVRYLVCVYVVIEHDEIVKVVVDDETAILAENVSRRVKRILDTSLWPGWTFGW
jgi:hypothetical protein